MTFQEKLDALPEMPERGQASTEVLAHVIYHAACHDALRARLALARELISAMDEFAFRDPDDTDYTCVETNAMNDARAFLAKLIEEGKV